MTTVPGQGIPPYRLTSSPAVSRPQDTSRLANPRAGSTLARSVALGLGCFALTAALLLPVYVYPRVVALPADPQQSQVLTATGATVLAPDAKAPGGARVLHDASVTIDNFVAGAPGSPQDGNVVWQIATRVQVAGQGLLNARMEQISLDPHTARPTNCCGDRLVTSGDDPGGQPLTHRGYLSFPFDVQKQSYQLWDVNTLNTRTAMFAGVESVNGIRTYRFKSTVALQKVGTMDLPGALFGLVAPSVTAESQYADTRTIWVEPATGNVIEIREDLTQQFKYLDKILPAFEAELRSPAMTGATLSQARTGAMVVPWVRGRASVVLVLVGLLLLAYSRVLTQVVAAGRRRIRDTRPTQPITSFIDSPAATREELQSSAPPRHRPTK